MYKHVLTYLALLLFTGSAVYGQHEADAPRGSQRNVVINGTRLSDETVYALETQYGVQIMDSRYWYDHHSGAWGVEGGPTLGFIPANMNLPGPVPPNASGGQTNVYVNGRALHPIDLHVLQQLTGPIEAGRYWLDALGNAGYEGGPVLVNLAHLARQAGSGPWSHYNSLNNTGVGGDGSFFYYTDRDGGCTILDGQVTC